MVGVGAQRQIGQKGFANRKNLGSERRMMAQEKRRDLVKVKYWRLQEMMRYN
jgi:hypothetical protein